MKTKLIPHRFAKVKQSDLRIGDLFINGDVKQHNINEDTSIYMALRDNETGCLSDMTVTLSGLLIPLSRITFPVYKVVMVEEPSFEMVIK